MAKFKLIYDDAKEAYLVDRGLLLLRVALGLLLAFGHGWSKLTGFAEMSDKFPDLIGLGSTLSLALVVFAEFFCALAIAVGVFTRLATIPVIITMAVAILFYHAADPFSGKELAIMYLMPSLVLLLTGPGKISIDHMLSSRKKPLAQD